MPATIEPQSDGELRLSLTRSGTGQASATVTASVWSPTGEARATDVALTDAGSGTYVLAWDATWTETDEGEADEGEYLVVVTAEHNSDLRTRHFRVVSKFDTE